MSTEVMRRVRQISALTVLLTVTALVVIYSCSNERPLAPGPARGRVYISVDGFDPQVYVIDVETDSLIDSIPLPVNGGQIECDPDAPRFVVHGTRRRWARFYNAGEREPFLVADSAEPPLISGFDAGRGLLISSSGALGYGAVNPATTLIQRFPSLDEVFTDTVGMSASTVFRSQGILTGLAFYVDEYSSWVGCKLCSYDYVNHRIIKLVPVGDRPDSNFIFRIGGHPNGRWSYLTVATASGPCLIGYDLDNERELFRTPIISPYGTPQVTPDGREVWYPEQLPPWEIATEKIMIFDARTGVLVDSVLLHDWRGPGGPIVLNEIRFSSDGKKAYTCSIAPFSGAGMFLIGVGTRTVVKAWHLSGRYPQWLDIGPAPG